MYRVCSRALSLSNRSGILTASGGRAATANTYDRPVVLVKHLSGAAGGSGGTVKELASMDDYQSSSKDKAVLYFTAKWCPPCRRIAPMYQDLAAEKSDVHFYKVDIDVNKAAAKDAGIMSVPTFIFYKNGHMVSKFAGADYELLEENVDKLLAED
ncbi:thioredoxin-like protein [Tribonema minus]|uniref:Thioredoxin-like protein n=1 Tax=Tribonema minus TaxID=303371 RepID=A0A836CF79_9STRA|nr:thioredoxin-like protein [Tribonema minus]